MGATCPAGYTLKPLSIKEKNQTFNFLACMQ
jgi:hypothetical protein